MKAKIKIKNKKCYKLEEQHKNIFVPWILLKWLEKCKERNILLHTKTEKKKNGKKQQIQLRIIKK